MNPNAVAAPGHGHPVVSRNVFIALSVIAFHILALWTLQSGLLRRAVEVLVPVHVLGEFLSPPSPALPTPPQAPQQPALAKAKSPPNLPPPPMPLAMADSTPTPPNAPAGVVAPQPPSPSMAAPVATVAVYPAAPPRVELPSSNADYLQNPKPQYPGLSKRLGEQGQVIHNVLIGVDGLPLSAELVKSSGFDRLDQAAYTAVMRWHYVPGKRNGVPTAMSFNVPINWVLE